MRISIDGNIGAGKTSILEYLATYFPTIKVWREPVDEWEKLLRLYHAAPDAWALPLNLKILLDFHDLVKDKNAFVERSPLACRHVFMQMEINDNRFDKLQTDVFLEYFDVLGWSPDAIIFVDVPSATCLQRIEKRGREFEKAIDLSYLRRVEYLYELMIKTCRQKGIPVVVVDGTQPEDKVRADIVAAVLRLVTSQAKKPRES